MAYRHKPLTPRAKKHRTYHRRKRKRAHHKTAIYDVVGGEKIRAPHGSNLSEKEVAAYILKSTSREAALFVVNSHRAPKNQRLSKKRVSRILFRRSPKYIQFIFKTRFPPIQIKIRKHGHEKEIASFSSSRHVSNYVATIKETQGFIIITFAIYVTKRHVKKMLNSYPALPSKLVEWT